MRRVVLTLGNGLGVGVEDLSNHLVVISTIPFVGFRVENVEEMLGGLGLALLVQLLIQLGLKHFFLKKKE